MSTSSAVFVLYILEGQRRSLPPPHSGFFLVSVAFALVLPRGCWLHKTWRYVRNVSALGTFCHWRLATPPPFLN